MDSNLPWSGMVGELSPMPRTINTDASLAGNSFFEQAGNLTALTKI